MRNQDIRKLYLRVPDYSNLQPSVPGRNLSPMSSVDGNPAVQATDLAPIVKSKVSYEGRSMR